ncbi:MAG: IS200/IS605 family transposase [Thermoanaerobaculia bacterium]
MNIHLHVVFSTKERRPLIGNAWRSRLHEYLGGCVRTLGGVAVEVGGVSDHVHALLSVRPVHRLSDMMRDVKTASSLWVHDEIHEPEFGWQDGYAAFSVSRSGVEAVRRYIRNQEAHHRRRSFDEELEALLRAHGIAIDPRIPRRGRGAETPS